MASGVSNAEIDPERAIPACGDAVADDPDDMTSLFHLGRAHIAAEDYAAARAPIERAAAADHPAAVNALGRMHFNGWALPQDDATAFALMERAHRLGYARATYNVGWFHFTGRGMPQDRARGLAFFREAAEAGYAHAAVELANALWRGDAGAPDPAEAERWLRRAADGGYVPAQANLADRLNHGDGVAEDDAEGYRYAVMAADGGNGYAAYMAGFAREHGRGVEVDPAAAAAHYATAAQAGDPFGQTAFGRMLAQGRGVPADPVRARRVLQLAVAADETKAQAWLGRLLAMGQGGPKDVAAALPLLEAAGEQPVALYVRGLLIHRGDGVAQDPTEGLALIRRAADAGLAEAQVDAAIILGGEGADVASIATALRYLERAAAQDDPRGLLALGLRLSSGNGIARDSVRALEMLERAAALGEAGAEDAAELTRAVIALDRRQSEMQGEMCARQITLCNRGCAEQEDGSWIYNTRDGRHWFHESGRLVPEGEAPGWSCPQ